MTRLGVITDVHLVFDGTDTSRSLVPAPDGWDLAGTEGRLRSAIDRLEDARVDGVVVLGDLAHHGDDETLDHALTELGRLTCPLWAAPGNHDVALRHDAVSSSLRRAGNDNRHSLSYGRQVAVLGIESVDWIMSCRSQSTLPVAGWGDDTVLVASHYPLLPRPGNASALELLVDGETVLAPLLARPAPTVVLSGHLHTRAAYADGSVLQLIFPAVIGDPTACSLIELSDDDGRRRVARTAIPSSRADEAWEFDGVRWLDATPTTHH